MTQIPFKCSVTPYLSMVIEMNRWASLRARKGGGFRNVAITAQSKGEGVFAPQGTGARPPRGKMAEQLISFSGDPRLVANAISVILSTSKDDTAAPFWCPCKMTDELSETPRIGSGQRRRAAAPANQWFGFCNIWSGFATSEASDKMKHFASPHIRYAEVEGSLVMLDLRTEAYYMFDEVATFSWRSLLATDGDEAAVKLLQEHYQVDPARLRADFQAFKRNCLERGFVQEGEPAHPSLGSVYPHRACSKFLFIRSWLALYRTVRALSKQGFARTYLQYASLPSARRSGQSDVLMKRSVNAFRMAENFFLIRSAPEDCLPRSLALFRFLRSTGLPAEHCIGVRRFPFAAHAWVEYHGRSVLDDSSTQVEFKPLARISA